MTEESHLIPPVRASARLISALVTGSFSAGMMGEGALILLKVGQRRRESAKQAQICLATLLKILQISSSEARKLRKKRVGRPFPRDMANSSKTARSVIWITVLAPKMAQYPARGRRKKLFKVSAVNSRHKNTQKDPSYLQNTMIYLEVAP
jgi:hypothetical protein